MVSITRLFDFPYYQQETYNLPVALATKKNGAWEKTSSQEYIAKANAVSRALLRMGVQKDDKIALISSNNRTEWNIMDIGILQTGAQNVPIYPTIAEEDYEYILNHSGSIYCFVSDDEVLQKVNAIKANVPTLKEVYSFNEISGCKHWSDLLLAGEDESNQNEVQARKDSIKTEDLATIIYTSGTTGRPVIESLMGPNGTFVQYNLSSTDPYETTNLREPQDKGINFNPAKHLLWPIPQLEIDLSGNVIKQNPGY